MNRLKDLRKEKGLSQKAFSEEIGVSYRTIQNWENGESQIKPDKAQQLAEYFGVSVAYLLGYTDFAGLEQYYSLIDESGSGKTKELVKKIREKGSSNFSDFFENELSKQYSEDDQAYYKNVQDYVEKQMGFVVAGLMCLPDTIVELIYYWSTISETDRTNLLNLMKALSDNAQPQNDS